MVMGAAGKRRFFCHILGSGALKKRRELHLIGGNAGD